MGVRRTSNSANGNLFKTLNNLSNTMGKSQSKISNITKRMSQTSDSGELTKLSGELQLENHKFSMLSMAQRLVSNLLKTVRETIQGIIQNMR